MTSNGCLRKNRIIQLVDNYYNIENKQKLNNLQ